MKFYTAEELSQLPLEELAKVAQCFQIPYIFSRQLLESTILEKQGDVLAKVVRIQQDPDNAIKDLVLTVEVLSHQVEKMELELRALRSWVGELDDDAIRVTLSAVGALSVRDLCALSYLSLHRLATSLGLQPDGTERRASLLKDIAKELKTRGLASRTFEEEKILNPQRKKQALQQLEESTNELTPERHIDPETQEREGDSGHRS